MGSSGGVVVWYKTVPQTTLVMQTAFSGGTAKYGRMRERQNYNEGSVAERDDQSLPVRVA